MMSLSCVPDELTIEVLDYMDPEDLLLILITNSEIKRLLLDLRIRPKLKKHLETCTLPLQRIKCYCQVLDLDYDQMIETRNPYWSIYSRDTTHFITSYDYPLDQYITYHQTPVNLRDPEIKEHFFKPFSYNFLSGYIDCFIRQFTLPASHKDSTLLETKMAIHKDFMEHQTLRLTCLKELLVRTDPDDREWESICRGINICVPPIITQTLLAYRKYPGRFVLLLYSMADNAQNAVQPHYWTEYEPILDSLR